MTELITVADAAEYLKVDPADPVLPGMLAAAIAHIDGPEGYLGRSVTPQTIQRRFCAFGERGIRLPYPPLIEITLVEYRSQTGAWSTLPSTSYVADPDGVEPAAAASLPYGDEWRITWRAGYDGASGRILPEAIRAAILMITGFLYRNREDTDIPATGAAAAMLRPFVVFR